MSPIHASSCRHAVLSDSAWILICCSGAAHSSSRSASGVPNTLHQQHLTPAQQATQAAITAPATHQDGKVPVRTGLAWAALGDSLLHHTLNLLQLQPHTARHDCLMHVGLLACLPVCPLGRSPRIASFHLASGCPSTSWVCLAGRARDTLRFLPCFDSSVDRIIPTAEGVNSHGQVFKTVMSAGRGTVAS